MFRLVYWVDKMYINDIGLWLQRWWESIVLFVNVLTFFKKQKMRFKKIILLWFWIFVCFGSVGLADSLMNFEQFVTRLFNHVGQRLPSSYQYIQLKYKNVTVGSNLYQALQKWVYLDYFPNTEILLPLYSPVKQSTASSIIYDAMGTRISFEQWGYVTSDWMDLVLDNINYSTRSIGAAQDFEFNMQEKIMQEVYKTITTRHFDAETINKEKLEYGAIKWLVEAVWDKYTVYFPPESADNFNAQIKWEYFGIGAYVEMPEAGVLKIVSPLDNSPAQKAWIKAGDIVTSINGESISENATLESLIAKIKWPLWSDVTLEIDRNGLPLRIVITRGRVVINSIKTWTVEMPEDFCYMKISMFSSRVSNKFGRMLNDFESRNCERYIFDLRDNPGGSLMEVSKMLDYIVPTGQPNVIVKSRGSTEVMSAQNRGLKLTDKNIVVLINKWSASASEIFAWTLREYVDGSILIWEKSYGKGSVQEVLNYIDGSMLKFTIAKRYTGKKQINVNDNGIDPDFVIPNKEETEMDDTLEAAKMWKFDR